MTAEVRPATAAQVPRIASMMGRAFTNEPLLLWPLGTAANVGECLNVVFAVVDARSQEQGFLWEAGDCRGAACWVPPGETWLGWEAAAEAIRMRTSDGGQRWDVVFGWMASKFPEEPVWFLDHIGVEPSSQGGGVGSALVKFGLERARADGLAAHLDAGNPRNIPYYERFGFKVVEEADMPDGGPHLWAMRWDP